jgi:hypothetical protein
MTNSPRQPLARLYRGPQERREPGVAPLRFACSASFSEYEEMLSLRIERGPYEK